MKPWNCGARPIFLIIPLPLLAQIRVKMTKAPFYQFESYFSSFSFFNFFNRQGTATPSSSYHPVHGWHPSVMNSWKSSHWSQSVGSLSFLFQQPHSIDRTIKNCEEFEILLCCCSCSVAQLCSTLCDPWTAARQASLSFTISRSLLKLTSIESVMPSNHLVLCCPLLLLPSVLPSIRVFSNELAHHIRQPKYWSFNFSISPSNEYSGLISFRMDWFDLLAV